MQLPSLLSQFLEGQVGVAEVVIWSHVWHSAACVLDTVQFFRVLHRLCVYSLVISPPQLTWLVLVIRDLISYSYPGYPTSVSDSAIHDQTSGVQDRLVSEAVCTRVWF